ncbi:MAG: hypothetical protein IJO08_01785 [Clostridia bacterium]|nr:hypothetical protein [Clostridia bacterium]
MGTNITDIEKLRQTRHALKDLLRKIDSYLIQMESVPARDANKFIVSTISVISDYTKTPDYTLIRDYETFRHDEKVFKYFDADLFKIIHKRRYNLRNVFELGQALLNTRAAVSEELDYIDVYLL